MWATQAQRERAARALDQDRIGQADGSVRRLGVAARRRLRGGSQQQQDGEDDAATHLDFLRLLPRTGSDYAAAVAARAESRSEERAWYLRALLVLQSPRPVFAALRDDSDEAAEARQDVVGAIVWLGGIAAVLATTVASTLLDDVEVDGSLVAIWAFLAGGLYGFGLYLVVGKVFHVALRRLGSRGSFRRARHVLAFAATPIALALLVYWPVRIALYGGELFRSGGADGRGAGAALAWVFYAFVVWALALLIVGVRTVHGWSWGRSLAGVVFAAAIAAGLAVAVSVLYAVG